MKLFLKLVANGLIVVSMLWAFSNASLWEAILASAALSILAYVIGDLWILRATNNSIASASDFGLAFVFLWLIGSAWNWNLTLSETFIISLAVAIFEIWFHKIMVSKGQEATWQ